MSKKQFIKRHHLIINKLRSNPCSFKDLLEYLEKHSIDCEENYVISKRTFERDVQEIGEIYNIDIEYSRSNNVYQIVQDANEGKTDRLIESFQIFNALNISDSLSNHIIIEKRRSVGTDNMHGLLHAIKNQFIIDFTHEKFWKTNNEIKIRTVYPLALKEARNRWYLVAKDSKDGIFKTFGLERITNMQITSKKYPYPNDFDANEKFKYSFGIITNEIQPEKIKLCLSHDQANYVKTLPLHYSQKIVEETVKECIIELHLSPTVDFIMELLSMGSEMVVLEPESLKIKIIETLERSLNNYKPL
ncbi:putative DNA-binding transcriptional regulator YafY [Flavobacterium sp. CG_9.1]|uniref:helix-turn-helix transcriptional regulator n=1 Tax=Flavobacterium sp. CG_9.1 TaxID=2787728 RepID=UPI0018CA3D98|nr:WYL domain-containing protein [Flavobacterium sp. CG_9.1]MBG6062841.1 putative DNA-binding transcriptional regulator YafY [Flavobacterium sp. CG_9.1]